MMRMPTALGCMLSGIRVSLISNLFPSSVSDRKACSKPSHIRAGSTILMRLSGSQILVHRPKA